jgi:D-cysteine desulfhydrase
LVPATRLQQAIGGPLVWVKRDDLTGFATAGHKARSLEFLVGDAVARGCDVLVTGGGAGSNFCAAAAAAAAVAGLECQLVVYGSAPSGPGPWPPNLAAAIDAGAQVHFTGRPDREEIDRAVGELAAALEADGRRPYPMPRGGATAVGAAGYVAAFDELAGQLPRVAGHPGVIVVATGSGATQAGLVAGRAAARRGQEGRESWRVLGATVSRPPAEIGSTVAALARACGSHLGLTLAEPGDVEIVDARGPGFGVASDAGERGRRVAFDTEGLVLDPVYTAKAFAVVLDLMAGGFDRPIVFWHTGGLPAALHHLSGSSRERSTLCPT